MRSLGFGAIALFTVLTFVSCNRDPNVAKRRYLESGNKYFEKGRYKEASIQYRNAIKIDPRYGSAHYKLGLTALRMQPQPDFGAAVKEFRRAVELIPPSQQEHWDAVVRLTEIYLSPMAKHDDPMLKEIQGFCADLLNRDPNSFDGHRLTGDLNYVRAMAEFQVKNTDTAKQLLDKALEEYRKADAAKSGDRGVTMQMARALSFRGDLAGAEQIYRNVIDKNKTYVEAYNECFRLLLAQNKTKEGEDLLRAGYRENPKQYSFLITLAQLYEMQNRRDDMLAVLQQIKSKAGEYPRAYFDVGDFYLRSGDGDSAMKEYREGIANDAKNKASYQKRIIEVLMRQGKRAEAADVNAQILKDNPNDNDARGVSAALLLDKGDVSKAMIELQQVVSRAPNNPVAHYNLGRAYFLHNDAEQARQQFAKAIELRPDYTAARLALAQLQVARNEFDAALKAAEDILKYDPQNSNAKLVESAALMGQKKFGDSRTLLDGMLKNNPNSADAVFQLGVVNLAEKQYKQAEEAFRKSYELNPANSRGLMGVVECYMAQDKVEQALQLLQSEVAKAPTRMDFHLAIGNVAVRAGRWDMAISEFQKVLAAQTKGTRAQGELYLRIGETYRRKGDLVSAINNLQAARQTQPDDDRVLSTLAVTLAAANRWPEARQVYEATVKLHPTNAYALNNLAYGIAEHGGDLDQALSMAQQAKQLIPTMPEVSDTLGWIYLKKNLTENALGIFQELVSKNPNQPTFRYHLGMALSQKGDKIRAREELRKALDANPSKDERQKIQDLLNRL